MRLPYVLGFTVMLATATVARADTYVYDYTYQNQTSTFGFTYDSKHLIATDETVTPLTCQLYTQCSTVSIDPTESEIVFNNASGGTLTINGLPSGFFTVGQHTSVSYGTSTISISDIPAAVTPEPSGLALISTGLLTMAGIVRRRLS